jgi:hypothetical protein
MNSQGIVRFITIVSMVSAASALAACAGVDEAEDSAEALGTAAQALTPISEAEAWVTGWTGPARGFNAYAHESSGGPLYTLWPGDPGANNQYSNKSDCSFFANITMKRGHSWTDAGLADWLCNHLGCPAGRPQAIHYHDTIVRQDRFTQITDVTAVARGDVIALDYDDGSSNTGHFMWADSAATAICTSCSPKTYKVDVIDSSENYHGTLDTRYIGTACTQDSDCSAVNANSSCSTATHKCSYTGVGKGTLRLYADSGFNIIGYSWSTASTSTAYLNTDSPLLRHTVVGRYDGSTGY